MFQGKWDLAQSFRLPLPPSLQMLLLQTTGGRMQVSRLMKIAGKIESRETQPRGCRGVQKGSDRLAGFMTTEAVCRK